jgi:SHS2 domain-containing protein
MTYEWREHTAEVELAVSANSPEQIFRDVADAFGRYVELAADGTPTTHRIELAERDRATLLVALLEELIYLADTEGFVPDDSAAELAGNHLSIELEGRRTAVQPIFKAATYHNLAFEQSGGAWHARVVLDV